MNELIPLVVIGLLGREARGVSVDFRNTIRGILTVKEEVLNKPDVQYFFT